MLGLNLFITLIGHSNSVTSLVNLPQMMFASGSLDQKILIWDINNNFKQSSNLTSKSGDVTSLVLVQNQYIFSGSNNSFINQWKINTGISEAQSKSSVGPSLSVSVLENDTIVTLLNNNTVLFSSKNLTNYCKQQKISNHITAVINFTYNFTNFIVTGSDNSNPSFQLRMWKWQSFPDFKSNFTQQNFTQKNSGVVVYFGNHQKLTESLVAINSNSLASGSCDGTIKIWYINFTCSIPCSSVVKVLNATNNGCVRALSKNKNFLFSGSDDKSIKIWDLLNDYTLIKILGGHTGPVLSLDSYNSNWLASGSADKAIKVWTQSFDKNSTVVNNTDAIYAITTLNNNYFATGSVDTTIKV